MPLIDTHTHYFPQALIEVLKERPTVPMLVDADPEPFVRYGQDTQYPLQPVMTDLDAKLALMDRVGISVSVLSVNIPGVDGFDDQAPAAAKKVNDELATVAKRSPGRLAWLAVLPMDDPPAAAEELRRAVEAGASGAMIYSNVAGREISLDIDWPMLDAAVALDVPILMHPTFPLSASSTTAYDLVSILGFVMDTSTTALRLIFGGLYDRYPNLKLIVAHVGGLIPYLIGRIDFQSAAWPGGRGALKVLPSDHIRKLYVDSVCLWPPALKLAVDFFGADHVMHGSDLPYWPLDQSVKTVQGSGLSDDQRASVEYATAASVMRIQVT